MKKLINLFGGLVLMAMLSVVSVSCDKNDDDKKPEGEYSIVGKWKSVKFEYYDYEEGELVYEEEELCDDSYYVIFNFKKDGSGTITYYEEGDAFPMPIQWSQKGKTLSVAILGEDMGTIEIAKLDASNLEMDVIYEYLDAGFSYKSVERVVCVKI